MKNIWLIFMCFLTLIVISCEDSGKTTQRLNGYENQLPAELKGLKVYSVSLGDGSYVKVAVLDDKINSTTYSVGKTSETVIVLDKQNDKLIKVKEIIIENDSLIICRKY